MPIRTIEEFQAAQDYFSDPSTPPDAKEKLRASMAAFSRAQSGEVDLSDLDAERNAATTTGAFEVPQVAPVPNRVGAPGVPSHLGGSVKQYVDPSFNEFVRQNSAALGSLPDDVRAQVMELGTNAPEYKQWADQQWAPIALEAQSSGQRVERLPADTFKTYEPEASLTSRLGKMAGNALDAGLAFAGGAADSGALAVPGAGTALAAADGPETASQWRQRQERHPVAATVGATLGSISPQNLVGIAARGAYGGLSKAAEYVAPRAEGLLALAGRTVGSGVVGGATAAAEGAVRDQVNQSTFGEAPTPGAGAQRFAQGAALGAGANLIGEGARAISQATREAHPEIAGAEAGGVRPGVMGLQATEGSPARRLEAQRVAQGDETLLNTASKNAAPKIADAASAQNRAMLDESAAETATIYKQLSTGGTPRIPKTPEQSAASRRAGEVLANHPNADSIQAFLNEERQAVSLHQRGLGGFTGEKADRVRSVGSGAQQALMDAKNAGATYPGTVYRVMYLSPKEAESIRANGRITNENIWSVGLDKDAAVQGATHQLASSRATGKVPVVLEIRQNSTIPVDDAPGSNTFGEGLIPSGHTFRVEASPSGGRFDYRERATMPPGQADADASYYGTVAREHGETQAGMLGIAQARLNEGKRPSDAFGGASVIRLVEDAPQRVSVAPVAEEVVNILEHHSPGGHEMAFFNDADLRREMPKLFDVRVLPIEQAARLAQSEGGWVQPLDRLVSTGILPSAVPMSAGKVGYLTPKEYEAPQFDALVDQLQKKANLDTNLQPDPRYGQLAAAATKARGEFPGLNELNAKQAERFTQHRERYEGAALRVGKNKEVPTYSETPHNDKAALLNALDQYKAAGRGTGAQARDQHFDAIANAADPSVREALREIPMARSVDELRRAMQFSNPAAVGSKSRILSSGMIRLNPTLTAIGSVPDIQALGTQLNPQLKGLLRQMRLKQSPSRVGIAALSGRIGLRGGVAGARATQAIDEYQEDDQVTREDLENLLRLKRATQRAQQ